MITDKFPTIEATIYSPIQGVTFQVLKIFVASKI